MAEQTMEASLPQRAGVSFTPVQPSQGQLIRGRGYTLMPVDAETEQAVQDARQLVTPTQAIRQTLQGLSLYNADEVEARLRSIAGEDYDTALADIRSKLQMYQQDYPSQAMAYEVAGGLVPAIVTTILTKKPSPAAIKFFPNLAKVTGIGSAFGGAAGYGASEQENLSGQLKDVAIGAGTGGLVGAGLYTTGAGVSKLAEGIISTAARVFGQRGRQLVNNEIQRIAAETGLTPDEIVEKIIAGEILAENPTVRQVVRAYRSEGGTPATTIYEGMSGRPEQTSAAAMDVIESGLGAGMRRNVVATARAADDVLLKKERKEYEQAYKVAGDATQSVIDAMTEVIARFPQAGRKLFETFRSETGKDPFFVVDQSTGNVRFKMLPTMRDAETLRRTVKAEADKLIEKGGADAQVGINLLNVERMLRDAIDNQSPEIAGARTNAAQRRTINDAFKKGRKVLSLSPDDLEIEFNDILQLGEDVVQSYRLGFLANIRSRMSSGNRKSMMDRLDNENSKEGVALRLLFPGDQLDEALAKIGISARSRAAYSRIIGGSDTAETIAAREQIGSRISGGEAISAMQMEPRAMFSIVRKIVSDMGDNLTEAQKDQVARVLVSQNPQQVRAALMDRTGMQRIEDAARNLINNMSLTSALAGAIYTGQ